MSEQIDWSKAPEGADKYNTHNSMFYKGERPDLQVFIHDQWKQSAIIQSNEHFVYRQTTPSWSGEGLPPVGTVLEAIDKEINGGTWSKMVVLAVGKHGKDDCLMVAEVIEGQSRPGKMAASLYTGWERSFRPIRTPEQIAADERKSVIDVACDDIEKQIDKYNTTLSQSIAIKATIEAMIDAGYRKP